MRILVVGASGFLGYALLEELSEKHEVVGTFFSHPVEGMIKLDMNNPADVSSALGSVSPDVVVLAAAEANVDSYETNPGISKKQLESAKSFVDWCERHGALLVFISTDFVFDGKNAPYKETDSPNPLNAYGRNKAEIEKLVQKLSRHLVLRTSTLYGLPVLPEKFVGKTILKLSKGEKVEAAGDWRRSPALSRDVAVGLSLLLEKEKTGLFHLAGSSKLSMFEAALVIARVFNAPASLVSKGFGSKLNLPALRPLDTTLDISRAKKLGIKMSSFEQGTKFVKKEMEKGRK